MLEGDAIETRGDRYIAVSCSVAVTGPLGVSILAVTSSGPAFGPNVSASVATPNASVVTVIAVSDPLALKRGDTVPLLHPTLGPVAEIPVTGVPVHFSNAKVGFDRPAPMPGEHNDAVYGDVLGYTPERIAELRTQGVI